MTPTSWMKRRSGAESFVLNTETNKNSKKQEMNLQTGHYLKLLKTESKQEQYGGNLRRINIYSENKFIDF